MIDCAVFEDMISAYADDELSGPDRQRAQEHLESCESCSALLEIYGEISLAAGQSIVPVPPALRENIMEEIRSGRADQADTADLAARRQKAFKRVNLIMTRVIPLAACLAFMLITLPHLANLVRSPSPPGAMETSAAVPDAAPMTDYDSNSVSGQPSAAAPAGGSRYMANSGNANDAMPAESAGALETVEQEGQGDASRQDSEPPMAESEESAEIAQDDNAPNTVQPDYYAIVMINGELPGMFAQIITEYDDPADTAGQEGAALIDESISRYYIIMPRETAVKYISEGYDWTIVELDELDSEESAGIIYWSGQ